MADQPRYPYPAAIDTYGNGGFRFAGMSHRGSILCLPSGIHGWPVADAALLAAKHFDAVLAEAEGIELLLIGVGPQLVMPSAGALEPLRAFGLAFEPMSTGAAARTYNILLGEKRRVAAALIAVS
ncbi:MAG: Mth938-like domain-containing protein [Hyphomicrobiaceae bacterium]